MKLTTIALTAISMALLTMNVPADDKAGDGKCEMMKKHDAAPSTEQVELNKLVTEMNSNIGEKKIDAMAAILTRLVKEATVKAAAPAPGATADKQPTTAGADDAAPKVEGHHH